MTNKVTHEHINALMRETTTHYNKLHGTTTVCQIVLQNGFTLAIGSSSCVDPSNFDEPTGRKYAFEDAYKKAEDKLWELEGYRLAMHLKPIRFRK